MEEEQTALVISLLHEAYDAQYDYLIYSTSSGSWETLNNSCILYTFTSRLNNYMRQKYT
jgi:hypothetical protein